jgi:hypothetical protein
MKPAIYKVGYKSGGSPQHIRMITDQKSPLIHCPAIHNCARSVINISDGDSNVVESTTNQTQSLNVIHQRISLAYLRIGHGLTFLMSQRQVVSTGLTAG